MKIHEFIRCNNSKIVFMFNGEEKTLTRKYVEGTLGIYWFAADLYNLIIKKLL